MFKYKVLNNFYLLTLLIIYSKFTFALKQYDDLYKFDNDKVEVKEYVFGKSGFKKNVFLGSF